MKQRQFVYVPAINPHTFMFFFFKGTSGRSYSLRTYPPQGGEGLSYADAYPYTADQILSMTVHRFDAPTHPTSDHAFWRAKIAELNEHFLPRKERRAENGVKAPAASSAEMAGVGQTVMVGNRRLQVGFPMLGLEQLLAHPIKGTKPQDVERILSSARSEDYVTWNVLQQLQLSAATTWWPGLLRLARADNPRIALPSDHPPAFEAWRACPAPLAYERQSRARMAASGNPAWVARSVNPKPVEGRTEVDLVGEGRDYLLFVEAKLEADISMGTTYDPSRNQIVRNIDVLLEQCGRRMPAFWILAKDRTPGRQFVQLIETYRLDPQTLAAALPHRDPALIAVVARNLAILCWRDVLDMLPAGPAEILAELRRRVG